MNFGKAAIFFLLGAFSLAGPLSATIEESYKELYDRFEEARRLFLEGKPNDSAKVLGGIASEGEVVGIHSEMRAARLLVELLRYLRSRETLQEFDETLGQVEADLKALQEKEGPSKELLAYLEATRKFLEEKPRPPKPLESFLPLDRKQAEALGKYAESLVKEDPIRKLQYDEALWDWARRSQSTEPGRYIEEARANLSTNFWSARLGRLEETLDPQIFADRLNEFSKALRGKNEAAVRGLFHPESAVLEEILAELQSFEEISLEYSGFGAPALSPDGARATLVCTVQGSRKAGGKMEEVAGEESVIFRKQGDSWLIERI